MLRPAARLLIAAVVLLLGCAHAKIRDAASGRGGGGDMPLFGSKFDAEEVDVTVDWRAGPLVPKNERATAKLTASDGSGLRLVSYEARAVLYGPLAFSEIHLVFENTMSQTREGTFSITLPDGATVSRFAMKLPQGWQEGEVVERQAARQTFETFLHRKVDPAMLETDGGNVFRGRVFPIFGNQQKEIVIAYTETFAAKETPYKLPLAGLPAVDQLDVQLLVPSQKKAFVLHRRSEAPEHDFSYLPPKEAADVVRGGRYAIARVSSSSPIQESEKIDSLAVLIDSSASRASTFAADVDKVDRVVRALGVPDAKVKVASFDQEVDPASSLAEIAKRRPGGASNLGAGLKWLAGTGAKRAVLVTDGEATTGARGAGALAAKVQELLRGTGIERIDAIAVGAHADKSTLKSIVTSGGLARDGVVIDGAGASSLPPESIVRSIRAQGGAIKKAEVAGATRVFPTSLATKGGGGARSALAFVELPDASPLRVAINGKAAEAIKSPEEIAPSALVERSFVEQQIRELEIERTAPGTSAERKKVVAQEIVDLSIRHRILTNLTAMLVLETEGDYARFHIPRDAMKDIPVVGPRGVEIVPRGGGHVLVPPSLAAKRTPSGLTPDEDAGGDRDADGIPDMVDKCPDEPETFNGFQDEDGCPDRGMVLIDSNHITILQQVHFASSSATILKESNELLDAIAVTLLHHPEFDLVGIFGHTDNRGDASANKLLSDQRALAVRDAIIARGVKANRLIAKGFGGMLPIDPGLTPDALAKNRRVELKILRANGQPTGIDEGPPMEPLKTPPGPSAAPIAPNMQHFRGKSAPHGEALTGKMFQAQKLIDDKKPEIALSFSDEWIRSTPDDMLAWIAQGRALDALHRSKEAARAYGSVLDLAGRPEHRRAAAGLLESVSPKHPAALNVAIDAYKTALDERRDHPTSHRLYAWSLARAGRFEEALDITLAAVKDGHFDRNRFPSAIDVMKNDAGILALAAARKLPSPKDRDTFLGKASFAGANLPKSASTALVLTWENDETDLDLLAYDPQDRLSIASVDARSGYGPELLMLEGPLATAPVRLEVQQVNQGPTGFVFGKVAIVRHDGAGSVEIDDRPFVIMAAGSAAKLGTLASPSQPK